MSGLGIILAFELDMFFGDPKRLPHPVRLMGMTIERAEGLVRKLFSSPRGLKAGGGLLALFLISAAYVATRVLLEAAAYISPHLSFLLGVVLAYTTISARSLHTEAENVVGFLREYDLPGARRQLGRIVGRDTQELDETEVMRGVTETVAENISDGVVAPLFYLALGGPALGMAYKMANTLDSMLGYRTDPYLHIGFFPARIDDVANFIPARLTGLLMVAAAWVAGLSPREAWTVLRRDGGKHPSPNAGIPEAAVAGGLGVRLGGPSTYFGIESSKPFINENGRPPSVSDWPGTVRLLYGTSLISLAILALAATALRGFWP